MLKSLYCFLTVKIVSTSRSPSPTAHMNWAAKPKHSVLVTENIFCQPFISSILNNWRASEASETLSGVTQLKIGDICLFYVWTYVRHRVFVFAWWSTPSPCPTKQKHIINWLCLTYLILCGCSYGLQT